MAVAVAQAYAASVAVHAAEEAVQLHGGIGMTWEHPAHLYLKRAKADSIAYGTAGAHREALAELVDLAAPDRRPSPSVKPVPPGAGFSVRSLRRSEQARAVRPTPGMCRFVGVRTASYSLWF